MKLKTMLRKERLIDWILSSGRSEIVVMFESQLSSARVSNWVFFLFLLFDGTNSIALKNKQG